MGRSLSKTHLGTKDFSSSDKNFSGSKVMSIIVGLSTFLIVKHIVMSLVIALKRTPQLVYRSKASVEVDK